MYPLSLAHPLYTRIFASAPEFLATFSCPEFCTPFAGGDFLNGVVPTLFIFLFFSSSSFVNRWFISEKEREKERKRRKNSSFFFFFFFFHSRQRIIVIISILYNRNYLDTLVSRRFGACKVRISRGNFNIAINRDRYYIRICIEDPSAR